MNTLTLLECIELGVACLGNTFISCAKVLAMSRKADLYRDNGSFIQSIGKKVLAQKDRKGVSGSHFKFGELYSCCDRISKDFVIFDTGNDMELLKIR